MDGLEHYFHAFSGVFDPDMPFTFILIDDVAVHNRYAVLYGQHNIPIEKIYFSANKE
jgi:hypothetical protein